MKFNNEESIKYIFYNIFDHNKISVIVTVVKHFTITSILICAWNFIPLFLSLIRKFIK